MMQATLKYAFAHLAFAALLSLLSAASCKKQEHYPQLVPPTVMEDSTLPRFTLSDGTVLHLEAFGHPDSTLLLVLHGGPGGDYEGLTALKALQNRFLVVFFDQRGTGLSQRLPEEQLLPAQIVADIEEIKNHFSPNKKMYLLGHSWGGALAAFYVQQHPTQVSKLLLAEPGALHREAAKIANTTEFRFSAGGTQQMLNSNDYLSFENADIADYKMAVLVNSDVGDYRDVADPEEYKKLKFNRFGFLAGYAVNQWQGNFDQSYDFDFVAGIKTGYTGKTMIMASDKSRRLGYDFQEKYHRPWFNQCEMVKIPDAGHYFIELNSEVALPLIASFFED